MDWLPAGMDVNPKNLIGRDLSEFYACLYSVQPGGDLSDVAKHLQQEINQQSDAIKDILDGKAANRNAEHQVPGTDRWFRTRYFPLYQTKRATGAEETYIDGVIAATVDITGSTPFITLKPYINELQNYELANGS